MTDIERRATVEADGEYRFPVMAANTEAVLEVDGDFGGGTVTPGYEGLAGEFVALKDDAGTDVTTDVACAWAITVPLTGRLAVKLAGAAAPELAVGV